VTTRRLVGLVLAGGILLAAAACGDDKDHLESSDLETGPIPTTTEVTGSVAPTTSAPTTADELKAGAQAVLDEYWTTYLKVGAHPDPNDPDLTRILTGSELANTAAFLSDLRIKGQAYRDGVPASEFEATVNALLPDSAHFSGCLIDSTVLYTVATDDTVNGAIGTSKLDGSLTLIDGLWKIDTMTLSEHKAGLSSCD
jgi:hypothetical protein